MNLGSARMSLPICRRPDPIDHGQPEWPAKNGPWRSILSSSVGWIAALLILMSSPAFARTYAYIPSHDNQRVFRIDLTSNSAAEVVLDNCQPYGAAVVPSGVYVLVTCTDPTQLENNGRLYKITNANFNGSGIPVSLPVGQSPRGVAVDNVGRYAYVANYGDHTVTQILISSFSESDTATIPVGRGPWAVAAGYDETIEAPIAYVGNFDAGTISVIADGSPAGTIDVLGRPIGLSLSPDGSRLYVAENHADGSGSVAVVRTADRAIIRRINSMNADGPWGLALGADGGCLYISHNTPGKSGSAGLVSLFFPQDDALIDLEMDALELTGIGAPKNGDFALAVSRRDNLILKINADALTVHTITGVNISGAYSLGTFIGGSPPTAPDALSAEANDHDTVSLVWTDHADDELGFKIERRIRDETGYVQVATVAANVVSYTDEHLVGATAYEYRIRAYNEAADSQYASLSEAVTTPEKPFSWCFAGTLIRSLR